MGLFEKFKKNLKVAAIAAGRMSKRTLKATVDAVQEGIAEEEAGNQKQLPEQEENTDRGSDEDARKCEDSE